MSRRSDVWVFNVRQHHIGHNISGPEDAFIHGRDNVDNPWFGKSGKARPEMQDDDLILLRRTSRGGKKEPGVVGFWKFHSIRAIDSLGQIPWGDKDYRWAIYCRPIQREIKPAFTENWDELPFSYRQLQSEVISLPPETAHSYLRALLDHEPLSEKARRAITDRYRIEVAHEAESTGARMDRQSGEPRRRTTEVDRRLRDEQLTRELKEEYNNRCQICGDRREQGDGEAYSEVHHIQPLGRPHSGPDTKSNMLVLCPNHHADFDNGIVVVAPETGELGHPYDETLDYLHLEDEHNIAEEHYELHLEKIAIDEAIAQLYGNAES